MKKKLNLIFLFFYLICIQNVYADLLNKKDIDPNLIGIFIKNKQEGTVWASEKSCKIINSNESNSIPDYSKSIWNIKNNNIIRLNYDKDNNIFSKFIVSKMFKSNENTIIIEGITYYTNNDKYFMKLEYSSDFNFKILSVINAESINLNSGEKKITIKDGIITANGKPSINVFNCFLKESDTNIKNEINNDNIVNVLNNLYYIYSTEFTGKIKIIVNNYETIKTPFKSIAIIPENINEFGTRKQITFFCARFDGIENLSKNDKAIVEINNFTLLGIDRYQSISEFPIYADYCKFTKL